MLIFGKFFKTWNYLQSLWIYSKMEGKKSGWLIKMIVLSSGLLAMFPKVRINGNASGPWLNKGRICLTYNHSKRILLISRTSFIFLYLIKFAIPKVVPLLLLSIFEYTCRHRLSSKLVPMKLQKRLRSSNNFYQFFLMHVK